MSKDSDLKFTGKDAWMGSYIGKGEEKQLHKDLQKRYGIEAPYTVKMDSGRAQEALNSRRQYSNKLNRAVNNDYDVRRTLEAKALSGDSTARGFAEGGIKGIQQINDVHQLFKKDHGRRGNNPDSFGSQSDYAQMTMAAVDHDRKVFNESIDSRIAAATAEKEEPVAEAPEEKEEYKPSRRLAQAQALVGTAKEDTVNNYIDIYKPNASKVSIDNLRSSYARDFKTDGVSVSPESGSKSQDFLDVYKQDVKESLKPA